MSDGDGSRRAWRARTGAKPVRLDFVWDLVGWFSLFPGAAMVFAALGARRGPHMGVDETWIWMLITAMSMLVLLLALAARRVAGVVPRRYPRTMFGWIIFISIAAPALAWVRLEGQISPTGWVAIGVSAATVDTLTELPIHHSAGRNPRESESPAAWATNWSEVLRKGAGRPEARDRPDPPGSVGRERG